MYYILYRYNEKVFKAKAEGSKKAMVTATIVGTLQFIIVSLFTLGFW